MVNQTVLVVDDEERIRSSLRGILSDEGFRVLDTGDAPAAMEIVTREHPALVLLDIWMPEMDGIELLRRIKTTQPQVEVIMLSGHGNIQNAVAATRLGAADFIEKPFSVDGLLGSIARVLERETGGARGPGHLAMRTGPAAGRKRERAAAAHRGALDRDSGPGAAFGPQDRRHPASGAARLRNRVFLAVRYRAEWRRGRRT